MENEKQDSIWENLADELGVEVDPDAVERKQPEPVDLPSASQEDSHEAALPERSKTTSKDWNALAESLGIDVPEEESAEVDTETVEPEPAFEEVVVSFDESESSEEAESQEPAGQTEFEEADEDEVEFAADIQFEELPELSGEENLLEGDFSDDEETFGEEFTGESEEDAESLSEEVDSAGMSGAAARDAFEALFADASDLELPQADPSIFDTPLEFKTDIEEEAGDSDMEESVEPEPAEASSLDTEEEGEERPKRRRRRRRGRRGRGEQKAETDEQQDSSELGESISEGESEESEEEESDRPRRRRRRRGRRGGKGARAVTDESASEEALDGDSDDDDDEFDEPLSAAEENGSKGGRRRASHRNLPTWSEAIGCIVDSNIEQRSKAPAKQSSRGRGRGRGRRKN